jgi:predicted Zn-dependent protease
MAMASLSLWIGQLTARARRFQGARRRDGLGAIPCGSMRRPLRRGCTLGIAALLCACTSVNPVTGRREVILMSPEQEQKIDEQASREIESQLGVARDPGLVGYVEGVGREMATHSPRQDVDYHFAVIEMEEPNAFALPGGHIYVSRGLLTVSNSQSELANVLGHEIGHVAARHAARQEAHVKTLGIATLLSDLMSGGAPTPSDSERISGHFVARYAREQEREADRIGQDLAISAGVDPAGLGHFLRTLDNLARLTQGFSTPQTYFATHPAARERMLEAAGRAQQHAWQSARPGPDPKRSPAALRSDRDALLDHIEGMAVGRPASEGVFLEERFLHPDLGFSLRFPHGWELTNQSAQVLGVSPKRDGVVLLQLDSEGDDPVAAAVAYAGRESLKLENPGKVRVGGLPAFRAEAAVPTSLGRLYAEITWVAHAGYIYRLVAGIEPGSLPKYRGIFRKFSHSFRPLTPDDAREITELRLRTVVARPGESLADLSARSRNEWDLVYTAVANGLQVGAAPPPGFRVKVAVREPYAPTSADDEPPPSDAAPE